MSKTVEHRALKSESIGDFDHQHPVANYLIGHQTGFRLFTSKACSSNTVISYRRRDFYKVSLLRGDYLIHYLDESIHVSGDVLSFFNPLVPYTIETVKENENAGYFIFTEEFYNDFFRSGIASFPLFSLLSKPIFQLNTEEKQIALSLFQDIHNAYHDHYEFKKDIILGKINELLHFGNRLSPCIKKSTILTRANRIYTIFKEHLERQFPIYEGSDDTAWRRPSQYAKAMNMHVNYLNRNLKNVTGRSTRELIDERYIKEAMVMLKHTNQNISEIAYGLSFNDVSNFNHLFKKYTGNTPKKYRVSS